ncbi:hypothetical protein [uncultured Tenacibaculum sp.]|uniref:hypothetical protein n=1 Tax=uncultured Tenacibaculum sp. TaxID=174713 RepID=UPI002633916A|nr:hypothetical protein [uncultured Tenacibaculum sp.]
MKKGDIKDKSAEELISILKDRVMFFRILIGVLIVSYVVFGYIYFYMKGDVFLHLFVITMLYISMISRDFKNIKEIKRELNSKEKENK